MGSLVLVRQHHLSKPIEGFAADLAPKFDGPYKVVAFPSPNVARIRLPGQRKGRLANIEDLKAFHSSSTDNPNDENSDTAKEDTGDQPGQSQRGQPTDTSNGG